MIPPRRPALALLALALCGGCYPYIPGRWADYWLPDTVRVVGAAVHEERMGGYWSDPAPRGEIWWGWFDESQPGADALSMLSSDGPGCSRGEPDEAILTSLLGDPGAAAAVLRGPATFELDFDSGSMRFEADADDLPSGSYTLDPVLSDEAGILEAEPLFSVPGLVALEGPELGGVDPSVVSLDGLDFAWDAGAAVADWVHIEVRLSSLESSGYVPYEWATCLVPFSDGSVSFGPALWGDTARADAVYVIASTVDESLVRVGERSFAAHTIGVRRRLGILRIE